MLSNANRKNRGRKTPLPEVVKKTKNRVENGRANK